MIHSIKGHLLNVQADLISVRDDEDDPDGVDRGQD